MILDYLNRRIVEDADFSELSNLDKEIRDLAADIRTIESKAQWVGFVPTRNYAILDPEKMEKANELLAQIREIESEIGKLESQYIHYDKHTDDIEIDYELRDSLASELDTLKQRLAPLTAQLKEFDELSTIAHKQAADKYRDDNQLQAKKDTHAAKVASRADLLTKLVKANSVEWVAKEVEYILTENYPLENTSSEIIYVNKNNDSELYVDVEISGDVDTKDAYDYIEWYDGRPGEIGPEFFDHVEECVKDVLNGDQVIENSDTDAEYTVNIECLYCDFEDNTEISYTFERGSEYEPDYSETEITGNITAKITARVTFKN